MNSLTLHRFKLLLFTLLNLADLVLTLYLLDQGNGRVYEGNPLASSWLHRHGSLGLTLYKALSMLVFFLAVLTISRRNPRVGGRVLVFGCLAVGLIVCYSGWLLAWIPPADFEKVPTF